MRRKRLRKLIRYTLVLLVLLVILNCGLAIIIARYGTVDRAEKADVIIVLGAGNRYVIRRRAAHGAELWSQGIADNLICTGGDTMNRRAESETCRDELIRRGVPAAAIFIETESRSTEENAIEARKIMDDQKWTKVVLVSDNYHLWRAQLIFGERFADDWVILTSPAQATQEKGDLPRGWRSSMMREIFATYWFVGKSLLGLPYTDFPD